MSTCALFSLVYVTFFHAAHPGFTSCLANTREELSWFLPLTFPVFVTWSLGTVFCLLHCIWSLPDKLFSPLTWGTAYTIGLICSQGWKPLLGKGLARLAGDLSLMRTLFLFSKITEIFKPYIHSPYFILINLCIEFLMSAQNKSLKLINVYNTGHSVYFPWKDILN